jgi:hypothetical protein
MRNAVIILVLSLTPSGTSGHKPGKPYFMLDQQAVAQAAAL